MHASNQQTKKVKIARRAFMIGSVALAGGVAFGVYKVRKPLPNPLADIDKGHTLNPYLIIDQNGVTIITGRAEMGQGVNSTLAALVAEELDVAWESVSSLHGPAAKAYYNKALLGDMPFAATIAKFIGLQATGGSSSIVDGYESLRAAGASARLALLEAAAEHLSVPASNLRTQQGYVLAPDGQKLSYQSLASMAAQVKSHPNPPLKPQSEWKLLGRSLPRTDLAGKVNGTAQYGIDVRLPDMVYASVRMCPRFGGRLLSLDDSAGRAFAGVERIINLDNEGIAAIAGNTWQAMQAVQLCDIVWEAPSYPANDAAIFKKITQAFEQKPESILRDTGNVREALARADKTIEAEYKLPYLAHACMEPMNATALYTSKELSVWTGNQAAYKIRVRMAELSGLSEEDVHVHTPLMGGGFGRRGEQDCVSLAVRLAMKMPGIPVKLTYSRQEDMQHDFYRPAVVARLSGVVGETGVEAFYAQVAGQSSGQEQTARILGRKLNGKDKNFGEGMSDQPYEITHQRVESYIVPPLIPVGAWRSVNNSFNGFINESFLDEMAVAQGLDAVEMRLDMLKNNKPSYEVVKAVAEMANWGTKRAGQGRGMAFTRSFGTPCAEICDVSWHNGALKIDKFWCAVDVGIALDPQNIHAQIFGGIMYGLSAAIFGQINFENGEVVQSNFHDYDAMRMQNAPVVESRILQNKSAISGIGEPSTPPSAPALCNAIYDLTGRRARQLPLWEEFDFS